MACHERGMALVTVVVLLAALLALAHILVEKVWQSTRQTAEAADRDRTFWAAQSGIEWARHRLAEEYRGSAGWQGCLVGGRAGSYPSVPAWVVPGDGPTVEIYVRDNPDGDDDPLRDNDLKVFVLARARSPLGAETLIEALCGLAPAGSTSASAPPGGAGEASDPALLPVSTFAMKP